MKGNSPLQLPLHGGQLRKIAEHYQIPVERLLDFSVNINPAGPPRSVLETLRHALDNPASLAVYPDLELTELKRTISGSIDVAPENIAVANGFAPLLDSALRASEIKRCLLPEPAFGEYRSRLQNAGVQVISLQLSPEKAFEYSLDTIRNALLDYSCDAILLANPQNPSGVLSDSEKILRLVEIAAENNVFVLLDEAFIDYCPSASISQKTLHRANVIVFRSVTKFFAIPGLRVAYAVGATSKIRAMNSLIAPWPVTELAANGVSAAVRDRAYADESRAANDRRRSWLETELAKLEITTYASCTNFLLLRFSSPTNVDLLFEKMIIEEQIVLRSCTNFRGLAPGHLRTAVRCEAENERLIRGLNRVLSALSS